MIRFLEVANQVRGTAGDHQVDGARKALGHAYGGGSQFFAMWVVGIGEARMTAGGRLEGKVALISGSARGMGEATARLMVAEGARVVLGDILPEVKDGGRVPRGQGDRDHPRRHRRAVVAGRDRGGGEGVRQDRRPGQQRRHPADGRAGQHDQRDLPQGQRRQRLRLLPRDARDAPGAQARRRRFDRQPLERRGAGRQPLPGRLHRLEVRRPRHDQGCRHRAGRATGSGSTASTPAASTPRWCGTSSRTRSR